MSLPSNYPNHRRTNRTKFGKQDLKIIASTLIIIVGIASGIYIYNQPKPVPPQGKIPTTTNTKYPTGKSTAAQQLAATRSTITTWSHINLKDPDFEIESVRKIETTADGCEIIAASIIAKNSFGARLRNQFIFRIYDGEIIDAEELK